MLSLLSVVCLGTLMMLVQMAILWRVHLASPSRAANAAWVDVGWAGGLGLLAVLYAVLGPAPLPRRILLGVLAGAWSFRLASHLYRDRVAKGVPEEGRYQSIRADWGSRAPFYFLWFFLGQGLLDVLLSVPFLLMAFNTRPEESWLSPWEWAGAALWIVGLAGESLADAQLKAFKADRNPGKGKVCRTGLWRYSRHPNYFFEWLIWCAYALMAFAAPWGWLGTLSALIILFLLLKVSGIPLTERHALKSRGEEYRRYQRETSAFVPWFPRKSGTA